MVCIIFLLVSAGLEQRSNYSPQAGHLFLLIKFYWNTATPIHLCIVCGCLHTIETELTSCDGDHMTHKPKIFAISKFKKIFPTLFQRVFLSKDSSDSLLMYDYFRVSTGCSKDEQGLIPLASQTPNIFSLHVCPGIYSVYNSSVFSAQPCGMSSYTFVSWYSTKTQDIPTLHVPGALFLHSSLLPKTLPYYRLPKLQPPSHQLSKAARLFGSTVQKLLPGRKPGQLSSSLCFSSLKDHSPMQTAVQCLKVSVSYFIQLSNYLWWAVKSGHCYSTMP